MADVSFYVMAAGAVVSAIGVIVARDLVRAALAMVAHFVLTAGLYLLLHAPFVAAAQLIVYAGAIMVLFLFVVMVLGAERADTTETLRGQRLLAALGLAVLGGLLVWVVSAGVPAAAGAGGPPPVAEDFGSPAALADALFRHHVLPFEIVSVLLLVAMIGAVVLVRRTTAAEPEAEAPEPSGGGERR